MTPEARQRVKNVKNTAERLRNVVHTHSLVIDFMRDGKGPSDVVWVCNQLEKSLDKKDDSSSSVLEELCTLLCVAQHEVVDSVRSLLYCVDNSSDDSDDSEENEEQEDEGVDRYFEIS